MAEQHPMQTYTYVSGWGASDEVHDAAGNRARILDAWNTPLAVEIYLKHDAKRLKSPSCTLVEAAGHKLLAALNIDAAAPHAFTVKGKNGASYFDMVTQAPSGLIANACPKQAPKPLTAKAP